MDQSFRKVPTHQDSRDPGSARFDVEYSNSAQKDMETPCATPLYCKRKATKFSYIQPQLLDLAHGVLKRKRS